MGFAGLHIGPSRSPPRREKDWETQRLQSLRGDRVFHGRFFYHGSTERFTTATYQAYLLTLLTQTDQPIILIHDDTKYHTSKDRQRFVAQQPRLTAFQLPSYSPDYNPIEFLWKSLKRRATPNRYFPQFETLITAVADALVYYAHLADEVKQLMGRIAVTS
jgi:transposase